MAQAATMGPPLSLREPRRSGRRSAPSASASTSKSPDSDSAPLPLRAKEGPTHRPSLSTSTSNGKNKRSKTEDFDDTTEDAKSGIPQLNGTSVSHHASGNGRNKRKPKEKDKQISIPDNTGEASSRKPPKSVAGAEDVPLEAAEDEEEEQGITRCVCGSTEDDPDAGEFMVQCETCKVWQHGLCMGFESEDQLHDDDYYCEQCKPQLHAELLKRLQKRPRQSSATSHHNSVTAHSRTSRSHSPSYMHKQPSKRRNTMNSRDANFDESIKEVMEASAAEAAAFDSKSTTSNGHVNGNIDPERDGDVGPSSRKKRKRSDDDLNPKKRTRSMSAASDRPIASVLGHDDAPVSSASAKQPLQFTSTSAAPKAPRQRRGGGRKTVTHDTPLEGEDGTTAPAPKRQNNSRAKASNNSKRPPASSHMTGHDRRNASGTNASNAGPADSRAYRNSHAYVVSQQPLFTSWNLPDYLAHLGHILPTDTPQPLEVRAGASAISAGPGRESIERTVERGVKVKWPSKRMSVGDMNKRVRALMDWVGREQASALDRGRRREALEKALKEISRSDVRPSSSGVVSNGGDGSPMVLDQVAPCHSPAQENPSKEVNRAQEDTSRQKVSSKVSSSDTSASSEASTMKMMEQLMEELIGFQERFGPGVRSRERERRTVATAA